MFLVRKVRKFLWNGGASGTKNTVRKLTLAYIGGITGRRLVGYVMICVFDLMHLTGMTETWSIPS